MNRARTGLLLAFLLAAPCIVYAQGSALEKKAQPAQMYEDIEVMRRILNRALHLPRHATRTVWVPSNDVNTWSSQPLVIGGGGGYAYPTLGALGNLGGGGALGNLGGGGALGNPHGNLGALGGNWTHAVPVSSVEYPGAEGVYLKGHGVVFNLTLPPQKVHKPDATAPEAKKLSEWERIRKEVRGEKPEAESTEKKPKEPTVVETLLKALADNGSHFAELAPDETVTIVVTFRPSEGGGQVGQTIMLNQGSPQDWFLQTDLLTNYYQLSSAQTSGADPTKETKTGSGTGPATGGEVASKAGSSPVKDKLLLGDLHYKQNKYADAVQAYTAALKELKDDKKAEEYVEICQKLAQALLAEGKVEEAKKYVDLLAERKKTAAPAPREKDPPPAPLPSKLILSAPKKLLDQVASSKVSFEEFKKDATVEYHPFAAPEKDAGEKGGK